MKQFWIFDSSTRLTTGFRFSILKSEPKKVSCPTLLALLFAFAFTADAQRPNKVSRIGFLGATGSYSNPERTEAFRQGLGELGYIEGKNILIEWRYADGKGDRLPALAAELVRLNVEVIVTQGSTSTRVAYRPRARFPLS